MGHIKEPKGIDFIIKSNPLTDKEQAAISEYIKNYKLKHAGKKSTISGKNKNLSSGKKQIHA